MPNVAIKNKNKIHPEPRKLISILPQQGNSGPKSGSTFMFPLDDDHPNKRKGCALMPFFRSWRESEHSAHSALCSLQENSMAWIWDFLISPTALLSTTC